MSSRSSIVGLVAVEAGDHLALAVAVLLAPLLGLLLQRFGVIPWWRATLIALLAHGCNLGPHKMSELTRGCSYKQLKRVSDWLRAFEIIDSRGRYLGHIGTSLSRDPRRGKGGMSMQYAQGWLMVHFLHSQNRLQRGIPRYLTAINRAGTDDEEVFREAFGMNYKQFDRAVKRYWADKRFATGRVEIASHLPEIEPEVRDMEPCEAEAAGYEALVLMGWASGVNEGLARDRFGECLERGVRPRDMRLLLIRVALSEEDWDDAESHIEALLEENPDDAAAMTARIGLERMRADDEIDKETAGSLRKRAAQAIMADPTYVPALMQYADLTFEHDLALNDNTVSVIDSIRFLAPDLNSGKIFEARLHAHHGAFDQALEMVDEMIKWSSSTAQESRLKELRKELEDEREDRDAS